MQSLKMLLKWDASIYFLSKGIIAVINALHARSLIECSVLPFFWELNRGRCPFVVVRLFHDAAFTWSFDMYWTAALWAQGTTDGLPWCGIIWSKSSVWSLVFNYRWACCKGTIYNVVKMDRIVPLASRLGPWFGLQFSPKRFCHSVNPILLKDQWVLFLKQPDYWTKCAVFVVAVRGFIGVSSLT